MLTPDEIRALLSCLPGQLQISVLSELDQGRVYEAERLACLSIGADRGHELIASLVRGTVAR